MALIPEYLSVDFSTLVNKIRQEIELEPVFRDYNYHGSNISLLIELCAYMAELNTYYLNKIAQNVFIESADIYETVNSISRQLGYQPKGHRTAKTNLTVTISSSTSGTNLPISVGDVLYVPAWHQIESTEKYSGSVIKYATTISQTNIVSSVATSANFSFTVPVAQGTVVTLEGYKGRDIVDNELIIPSWNYAYDDDIDDDSPTIQLSVDDNTWLRVSDFYSEISALQSVNDVYMFVYDKYERSKIIFNSARNVPESNDNLVIKALRSLGENGTVGSNTITSPDANFVQNLTTGQWISNDYITVTNVNASTGAGKPETITELKENAISVAHSQYRNVTKSDYISHLESRSDITNAACWGEQDIAPSGNVPEYNKVYVSVIPTTWSTGTINTSAGAWVISESTSGSIFKPLSFSTSWQNTLKTHLEDRKMISAYEVFQIPEIIYFHFEIGVRIKRMYTFTDVSNDVKSKLIYWFRVTNREFNETIKINDIIEYLMDITEVSPTNNFTNIKGVRNINIRDIRLNKSVYEPNLIGNYPQFATSSYSSGYENILRPITLGLNQFPMLVSSTIIVIQET